MIEQERHGQSVDLATFTEDPTLCQGFSGLLQLKGFNRLDRVVRSEVQQSSTGRLGSTSIRPIAEGALIGFGNMGELPDLSTASAAFVHRLPDPRGLCFEQNQLWCASVDTVLHVDLANHTTDRLRNPWFAFLHSVATHPGGKHILVSSAGFDRLIEIDITDGSQTWEWVAWDHGLNQTVESRQTVYSKNPFNIAPPEKSLVIDSPAKFPGGLGLPPGDRTAFPNSSIYKKDDPSYVYATLFHGGLIEIDKKTGNYTTVMPGLNHPHSVAPIPQGYVVANTASGQFVLADDKMGNPISYSLQHLPDNDGRSAGKEWLQQAKPVGDGLFACVDSHRAAIHFVDMKRRCRRKLPYDPNWVVQEIMPLPKGTVDDLGRILSG